MLNPIALMRPCALVALMCLAAGAVAPARAAPLACEAPTLPANEPLSLERALARLECHPAVRSSKFALQGSRADEVTAGQRPNPTLTIGANSVGRGMVGPGRLMDKTFDHQVRVDQVLERGGKRDLRMQAAAQQSQAAALDLAQVRRDARADIGAAFVDLQAAQAKAETLGQFVQFGAQSLRLVQARVKAGDAPALDLARLQADDARLRADAALAQAEAAGAAARLAVVLGLEARAPLPEGGIGALALPRPPDAADLQRLLDPRPEVRAARARAEAAERLYSLARAQRTRDVSVGLQADRYPASMANPSGNGNTVSLTVSVPLFLGHAYEGETARALADWQQAQDQLAQVREAARAHIEEGLAQFRAARQRRELVESQVEPAAERLAQGAEAAYARGGISMLDLIEARRGLRAARLERLSAQVDDAKAALRWQSLDIEQP